MRADTLSGDLPITDSQLFQGELPPPDFNINVIEVKRREICQMFLLRKKGRLGDFSLAGQG